VVIQLEVGVAHARAAAVADGSDATTGWEN
jgi:hypothetical protein